MNNFQPFHIAVPIMYTCQLLVQLQVYFFYPYPNVCFSGIGIRKWWSWWHDYDDKMDGYWAQCLDNAYHLMATW